MLPGTFKPQRGKERNMQKIVECVPNFSEGRDRQVIEAIAEAIRSTPGCTLLDVDPGQSTHRTVYTFVGSPVSVVEGALNAARIARGRIDMRHHHGEHPRMGALDVCPFVPVSNVSMEECVAAAREFARRAAEELQVPIFLYEEAAGQAHRKHLPQIREGEYEGLEEKLKRPEWRPDFGPARFVPEWGATVAGARRFLIALNVNVLGTANQAHRIALDLREAGRGPAEPGRLKEVKGMGWYVDEYNLAQVTVNLTDYHVTPPHVLFEEVKAAAERLQVGVAGSEIVGLIPLEAMLLAADYYNTRDNLFIYEEDQKIRLVIDRQGLNSVAPFNPREKIIEYRVAQKPREPLAGASVRAFIEAVGARTSAPGGGSASAVMAAMGAALGAMVAKLTYGVRKFESVDARMRAAIPALHQAMQRLIPMIDADTSAFNEYLEGVRMPQDSEAERAARRERMQHGLQTAVEVPLTTMRLGDGAWEPLCEVARYGNPASRSDVEVGARALAAGIWGAYRNVLINLQDIEDAEFKARRRAEAQVLVERAAVRCAEVERILEGR
jgi:glutamate formiminotransferase/formiminotetrahydrofolate cyclodeaminase